MQHLQLTAVPTKAFGFLYVLTLGIPLAISLWLLFYSSGVNWLEMSVIMLIPVIICLVLSRSLRKLSINIEQGKLNIGASFYKQQIELQALNLVEAKVVNLESQVQYKPGWKTNGIGLLFANIGWYKLKNGDKAFVVQTTKQVLLLPTTKGFKLLLSVEQSDELLQQLKHQLHHSSLS